MNTDSAYVICCRLIDEAKALWEEGRISEGDEKMRQAKELKEKYFGLTDTITSDRTES